MFRILYSISNFLFFQLWKTNFNKTKKSYLICDIDNTIADTWPSLTKNVKFSSEKARYSSLALLNGSAQWVLENKSEQIIFLSARPFIYFFTTRKWLKQNGFNVKWNNVILVENAQAKLPFFKFLNEMNAEITVIDDLTYNHENDNIKYYSNIIRSVKEMDINYIDYESILKLNVNQ